MPDSISIADKLRIAGEYAAATRANDAAALAGLNAPDHVTWHNFDEAEVDGAQSARTLAWLHRTVPDIEWQDVAVRATEDGFVWQSLLTGTAPGGPIRAHSCVVATLDGEGRVARLEEYLDRAQLSALSG